MPAQCAGVAPCGSLCKRARLRSCSTSAHSFHGKACASCRCAHTCWGCRLAPADVHGSCTHVPPAPLPRYTTISEQVYRILLRHTRLVQPLSCDEAYLDASGMGDPEASASAIRAEIQQASCLLQARCFPLAAQALHARPTALSCRGCLLDMVTCQARCNTRC